jgi:hypothetical protein
MKPDFTTINHKPSGKDYAMEASIISCCKEIQDTTIGRQVDVDHLLGFPSAYS